MTGPEERPAPSPGEEADAHDSEGTGEHASAGEACAYDVEDPENLEALWLTFQRERSVACPVTDTPFELALAHDPAEDGSSMAEVQLPCARCGRTVVFSPPDGKEVFGWAE